MTRIFVRHISLAAVFAATVLAGAPEGKVVFTAKCQGCHGPTGDGKEAIEKMFKVKMQPLSSQEVQAKTDASIKQTITAGQGKMKAVAGLTDAQIADVIAHVRTLKK